MDKNKFEQSVQAALLAPAKAGTKWQALEKVFSADGLRGSGALNNDPAERKTRVRQLLTTRKHPGFEGYDYSRHCVFVLGPESAKKLKAEPEYLGKVVDDLKSERPNLPPAKCMETVLVVSAPSATKLNPVAVVQWGESALAATYKTWYPAVKIVTESIPLTANEPSPATWPVLSKVGGTPGVRGENIVFFGPPGTGKSHRASAETAEFAGVIRTVFHPEYAYAEFVGSYKPVSGEDPTQKIVAYDGTNQINRPVIYYAFEPGVLIRAIAKARANEDQPVALIIEEINRGDCAAIFGDFLQLLDRADDGQSQYGIRVAPELGKVLTTLGILEGPDSELFFPKNLFLIATMNTSDQALFPMDSAFKRRWSWISVPIDYGTDQLGAVEISPTTDAAPPSWLTVLSRINAAVVEAGLSGDKRIGPWYIKPLSDKIDGEQVRNKLLFYLWHDVFRDQAHLCFNPNARTFDDVQRLFDKGGLTLALSPLFPAELPQSA